MTFWQGFTNLNQAEKNVDSACVPMNNLRLFKKGLLFLREKKQSLISKPLELAGK